MENPTEKTSVSELKAKQDTNKLREDLQAKVDSYKASHPGTAKYVSELSRDKLENEYILRLAQRDERLAALNQRVKEWIDRPENKNIKDAIKEQVRKTEAEQNLRPTERAALYMRKAREAMDLDRDFRKNAKEWINKPENSKLKAGFEKEAAKKPFAERNALYMGKVCEAFSATMDQAQRLAR